MLIVSWKETLQLHELLKSRCHMVGVYKSSYMQQNKQNITRDAFVIVYWSLKQARHGSFRTNAECVYKSYNDTIYFMRYIKISKWSTTQHSFIDNS